MPMEKNFYGGSGFSRRYFERSSFYESLLLFSIHTALLARCSSVKIFHTTTSFVISLLQIVIRMMGFQSSLELTSTWFQGRQGAISFGMSYAFYLPQIFFLGLLVNHEQAYGVFIGSTYANQLLDYLNFSLWLYILATTFLLFHSLVYESRMLHAVILVATWIWFSRGFSFHRIMYWLLTYGFGYGTFLGASWIHHTWSFGEYSAILLVITTLTAFAMDYFPAPDFWNLRTYATYDHHITNSSVLYTKSEWLETLLLALGVIGSNAIVSAITIVGLCVTTKQWRQKHHVAINRFLGLTVLSIVSHLACVCTLTGKSPLHIAQWLMFRFMASNLRWGQLAWSALMSFLCAVCSGCYILLIRKQQSSTTALPLLKWIIGNVNIVRKLFHLFVCLTLMPLLESDTHFTLLSTTCVLSLFIYLELSRVIRAQPLANWYSKLIQHFLNDRDTGNVIVSHINLLVGVAVPIWLIRTVTFGERFAPDIFSGYRALLINCGLVSVGVGDSIACIVGILLTTQRSHVLDTQKTIAGALSSLFVQILMFSVVFCRSAIIDPLQFLASRHFQVVCGVSALSSVLELLTSQSDNLLIPLLIFPIIAIFV